MKAQYLHLNAVKFTCECNPLCQNFDYGNYNAKFYSVKSVDVDATTPLVKKGSYRTWYCPERSKNKKSGRNGIARGIMIHHSTYGPSSISIQTSMFRFRTAQIRSLLRQMEAWPASGVTNRPSYRVHNEFYREYYKVHGEILPNFGPILSNFIGICQIFPKRLIDFATFMFNFSDFVKERR